MAEEKDKERDIDAAWASTDLGPPAPTSIDFDAVDPFGLCGTTLDGRYHVQSVVGRGGFGIVYRGMNRDLKMPVAVKCLRLPRRLTEAKRARLIEDLREEGRTLAHLAQRHDAIVRPIEVGSVTTPAGVWIPYLVLEWLEGETLKEFLRKRDGVGVTLREAMTLLDPAANALSVAHAAKVAHRDIKPENLFLAEIGGLSRLKLLDFGIAKVLGEQQVFLHEYTSSRLHSPFTPLYGAPEQFDSRTGATGPWTDVFALALVLVELLSGRAALDGNTHFELSHAASNPRLRPSPRSRGVEVPDSVEAVVLKALQVRPRDRYENADVFWRELVNAASTATRARKKETEDDPTPVDVLYIFSDQDEDLRQDLELQLVPLLKKEVRAWHPREIGPHTAWSGTIHPELGSCKIVLVMVSQALIDSGYCYNIELQTALERHRRGELRVVPLRLRPTSGWRVLPFRGLVAVPRFGTPLTAWQDPQEAWEDVAESLRLIAHELRTAAAPAEQASLPLRSHELVEVFKLSGAPDVTFVETKAYRTLKSYLKISGRGVVIEGPSGVGKTTALEKAIRELKRESTWSRGPSPVMLNARRNEDVKRIETIESWHKEGMVAIDDFHRLGDEVAQRVANYMKWLADEDARDKKLVIVGIPGSGQALIKFAYDLAMRIDVLALGRVESQDVMRMIEKGEEALQIQIERKSDIALVAAGSFNIAQFLCLHICASADINETQDHVQKVSWSLSEVLPQIVDKLSTKFKDTVFRFGSIGGRSDLTAVMLLKQIPGTEDGFLSLPVLSGSCGPLFAEGIRRLLDSGELTRLYRASSSEPWSRALGEQLFFDEKVPALIVEDPQLMFYVAHSSLKDLARQAGKGAAVRARVVIFHSRYDGRWAETVEKGLRAREYDFDVSRDELRAGPAWKASVVRILDQVAVAILLISADSLPLLCTPDFLRLLEERSRLGMKVLPILLSPLRPEAPSLGQFTALNPTNPIESMTEPAREAQWRDLITLVRLHLTREV